MTITITDAIKAVRLHIAMCDAANPEAIFRRVVADCSTTSEFIVAARAGYKATLEFLLDDLEWQDNHELPPSEQCLAAVHPLISHLDATRPNWRTE